MHAVNMLSISLLILVVKGVSAASEEINIVAENATETAIRSGRKETPPVYSSPDTYVSKRSDNFDRSDNVATGGIEISSGFEPSIEPRLTKGDSTSSQTGFVYAPYEEYVPVNQYNAPSGPRPRYFGPETNGPIYKSASSSNWNVWRDDQMDSSATSHAPDNSKGGQPGDFNEYYFPSDNWKGDPWTADQMSHMMMMMNHMQAANKPKFGGILSKLTQDPIVLLIVAILPLSLILMAVLPTFVNMMMNGGLPTITTTATGKNNGRGLDNTEFLTPVIQTITTFGARSFDNPDCMQKIFCQVTKGGPSTNGSESRSFQKALYTASRLVDGHWLESFGVKTLFDSMADGNCEKIPCLSHSSSSRSANKRKKS